VALFACLAGNLNWCNVACNLDHPWLLGCCCCCGGGYRLWLISTICALLLWLSRRHSRARTRIGLRSWLMIGWRLLVHWGRGRFKLIGLADPPLTVSFKRDKPHFVACLWLQSLDSGGNGNWV